MKSLYDQTSPKGREIIALLLGFSIDGDVVAGPHAGFNNNLREISALPSGWTYGDAVRAYMAHLAESFPNETRNVEEVPL